MAAKIEKPEYWRASMRPVRTPNAWCHLYDLLKVEVQWLKYSFFFSMFFSSFIGVIINNIDSIQIIFHVLCGFG